MFYQLFKGYARLAIKIYCRRIIINQPEVLKSRGPLLLAANHPNSFLDGIILTTLFDQPVHSLARGDAFRISWVGRLLRRIRLLPVYRTSEGVENLEHNYTTFAACQQTFRENGIVLIFSEGRCENEWQLRPLKKGTARLSISSWEKNIPLQVIPVAFNYSSFKKFGKELHLFFGRTITRDDIDMNDTHGKQLLDFNALLHRALHPAVYKIDEGDTQKLKKLFPAGKEALFYLLLLPALTGFVLHLLLYYPAKLFTERNYKQSGHYDSVLITLLLLGYPVYCLLLTLLAFHFFSWPGLFLLLFLPFTAWASMQVKYQLGW